MATEGEEKENRRRQIEAANNKSEVSPQWRRVKDTVNKGNDEWAMDDPTKSRGGQ